MNKDWQQQINQINQAFEKGKKRASVVVLATHATQLYGPPDALVDFIKEKKVSYFVIIKHPLDIGLNRNREVFIYKKGVLVDHQKHRESRTNVRQFIKDVSFTRSVVKNTLKQTGVIDLYIGANPLNFLAGSLALPKRKIRNWVFYSVDYSPKRFDSLVLNGIYRFLDDWAARYADWTFSVSKRAIEQRVKTGGAARERMVHTPNGVVEDLPSAQKNSKKPSAVYVGTLSLEKGIQDVINAWQKVQGEIENVELKIIGSGSDEKKLQQIVRKNKLSNSIKFLGQLPHDEAIAEVAKCDVGIALYNNRDSYTKYCDPMKVREYLASNVIPVVSDVPEIAQEVAKNNAGEVINKDQDIVQALIKALKNPQKYQAGINKLKQGNSWNEVFSKGFKRGEIIFTKRPFRRILATLWNPGEKEIAAGGFRRCHEILKRFTQEDGVLMVVDANPSIMRGEESDHLVIFNYQIPRWLKRFEKTFYNVERVIEWLVSMWKIFYIGFKLRRYYDLVYVPFSEIIVTSFGAGPLKWFAKKRVVFCNENTDPKWITRTLNNWLHNHIDRSYTISDDLASGLINFGMKGPMVINYTGLDVSLLKKIKVSVKKYDAIFIGRHTESKGIFDYVKMLPIVTKKYPDFKFVSVGITPPEIKRDLVVQLKELNVEDHWEFMGVVSEEEKYKFIKQSRTVWFLSTLEGWGIVPQEALACEVLPLCYDIPVYKESIRESRSVVFVKPNDYQAAAREAIKLMQMNKQTAIELQHEGALFVERFDWEVVAKREFDVVNGIELGRTPTEEFKLLN